MVNSNWYILMRNEHNHPTEFHPTAENPAYTTFQVKRAAHLAQQLLDYTDTLNRYWIEPVHSMSDDVSKNVALTVA